jgi:hypothetical protein
LRQPRLPGAVVAPVWDPTEHEFQLVVIEACRTLGWRVAHFRLVKDVRRGWISPEQHVWGDWINRNGGDWDVWRPQDWPDRIMLELGGKVAA